MWVVMQLSERLKIWTGCTLSMVIWRSKIFFFSEIILEGLISMILHNACVFFFIFSTFAQSIFKGWGCDFTWSFDKVMRSKSMKIVFVARMIRHKWCMIHAFIDFFFSEIIFDQKLFPYCWYKVDYQGFIVYLSCSYYWDTFDYPESIVFLSCLSNGILCVFLHFLGNAIIIFIFFMMIEANVKSNIWFGCPVSKK